MEKYLEEYRMFYKDKYLISKKKLPCKKCKEPLLFKEDHQTLNIYCKNKCNTNYTVEIREYTSLIDTIKESNKHIYHSDFNILKEEDYQILKNHLDQSKLISIKPFTDLQQQMKLFNKSNNVDGHISKSQEYYKDYLKLFNQKQEIMDKIKQHHDKKDIQKYIELNQTMNSMTSLFYESLHPSNLYL